MKEYYIVRTGECSNILNTRSKYEIITLEEFAQLLSFGWRIICATSVNMETFGYIEYVLERDKR